MSRVKGVVDTATRTKTRIAVLVIVVVAIALAVAYFPAMFDRWIANDDEGFLLQTIRGFLERGSLYHNTESPYGPFYYLLFAPIYWLTGKQPTLDNGRLIVLFFTTCSAGLFAAAVWRVTKSLPWAVFCQVGTFLLLITVHPSEPMHPGSLIALLLGVLALALAVHATSGGSLSLGFAGAAVGAMLMTKINVGIFALIALLLAFAIGNRALSRRMQVALVVVIALSPFVLMRDHLDEAWVISLAAMVAIAVLTLCSVSLTDATAIRREGLLAAGGGLLGVVAVCLVFLLATGSPVGSIVDGVLLDPLRFSRGWFIVPTDSALDWNPVLVTLAGIAFVLVMRRRATGAARDQGFSWPDLVLAGGALWLFGLGVGGFGSFAAWVLPLAVLPALAITATARPEVRSALRLLVPLAILQVLHAYPVAGSQRAWSTVVMGVPCAIAIAAGAERLAFWTDLRRGARAVVVGALCVVLALGASLSPLGIWKHYRDNPPLDLPGARLLRIDAAQGAELRRVTATVRAHCDALWFSPWGFGSFLIFTGLDSPTGLFAGLPPGLLGPEREQRVIHDLKASERDGRRLCILTDNTPLVAPADPAEDALASFVAQFTTPLKTIGRYTISVRE